MSPFSLFEEEFGSRMIVEAGAGTGKTYQIVGLYLRLLIEKKLPAGQILVVTFTRMATRELRERILSRLREALSAIASGEYRGEDPFLKQFVRFCDGYPHAEKTLREVILNYDDVEVHTIHGFCQKVLSEEALLAGMPFQVEISQQNEELIEASEEFWREFVYKYSGSEEGRSWLRLADGFCQSGKRMTPESLRELIRPLLDKPYALLVPDEYREPACLFEQLAEAKASLRQIWEREQEEICAALIGSDIRGATESAIRRYQEQMREFLDKPAEVDPNFGKNAYVKFFTSAWLEDPSSLKKNKTQVPEHPYFRQFQGFLDLLKELDGARTAFLLEAASGIRKLCDRKKEESSTLTYQDLLQRLESALCDPERGEHLAGRLRSRFPYALVDEFQDTDPVQYRIFNRIYPRENSSGSLVMIGDPKQAIYGFRGADVHAYLRARDEVPEQFRSTLRQNFRSSQPLISGVNAIFTASRHPFIEQEIEFLPAEKGERPGEAILTVNGRSEPPLSIWYRDGVHSKESLRHEIRKSVIHQVAELIDGGRDGSVRLGESPLKPGDIAVLVNSNQEASRYKKRFKEIGIDAVIYSRDKVFETAESGRICRLMLAVLDPADERAVRNSLVTGFFGLEISELWEIAGEEEAWLRLSELMDRLRERWLEAGFYPMFRMLLYQEGALRHLAGLSDCERVITNLHQLAEICSDVEQKKGLDPAGLLQWFLAKMEDAGDDDEETLRLESDRDLVTITTVHKSKGLEYPVVFCPSIWDAGKQVGIQDTILEYHDPEQEKSSVLFLEQGESENREYAWKQAQFESVSEEVRKAYVALTRARVECRLFWGASPDSHFSGLAAALLGGSTVRELIEESVGKAKKLSEDGEFSADMFPTLFRELEAQVPGSISVRELEEDNRGLMEPVRQPGRETRPLVRRELRFPALLRSRREMYSFSSLIHHDPDQAGEPDYDQWIEGYMERQQPVQTDDNEKTIFTFPRGARAGILIHKLFEHPLFDFRKPEGMEPHIRELLQEQMFDEEWAGPLAEMMRQVSFANYPGLNLSEVSPKETRKEMEFHFRTPEAESGRLLEIIRNGLPGHAGAAEVEKAGYMTGFIDLIVLQGGKWYILDYKSNWLGDKPIEYSPEKLKEEILASGYDLQYHIYTVALKKYLEQRQPGFNYNEHFGGVCYLFVRGMEENSGRGIFYHKPDESRLLTLEQELER
ncbi:MAG: exodeoxyribonuclease V subunit beta [Balneolaceae bacterium]